MTGVLLNTLQNIRKNESYWKDFPDIEHHYGTTNVLAIDSNGDIAGCTTTSGLSFQAQWPGW